MYEQATEEKRIKEDLGADSLDVVELSTEIEKETNVSVPLYIIEGSSVGEIVDYLIYMREERS